MYRYFWLYVPTVCNVGDLDLIPGLGRSSGEGNGNPLQYSCLENPMDGGAWWVTVHGVTKSQTRLRDFTHSLTHIILKLLKEKKKPSQTGERLKDNGVKS